MKKENWKGYLFHLNDTWKRQNYGDSIMISDVSGQDEYAEYKGFLRCSENYYVWYYSGADNTLYIYQNSLCACVCIHRHMSTLHFSFIVNE